MGDQYQVQEVEYGLYRYCAREKSAQFGMKSSAKILHLTSRQAF
jgi:hypothetical protein